MSLSAADREYLRESRRNSGVPERVTDQRAVEQVAGLVLSGDTARSQTTELVIGETA